MNKHIRELALKATGGSKLYMLEEEYEKFAELIIRECVKVIDPTDDLCSIAEEVHRYQCIIMIKEHFGQNVMNSVRKYRKKSVVIEAMRFTYSSQKEVAEWCGGTLKSRNDNFEPYIQVHTLEGTMTASLGDYVIKGVKGEFYPCKPEIFSITYEEVE